MRCLLMTLASQRIGVQLKNTWRGHVAYIALVTDNPPRA